MMFMKVIAKRRRILVHLATCSFLVYLLYQLRRNGDDLGHRVHHRAARDKDDDASGILPTDLVREELKRLFKKADTTADGLVSKKELSWSISRSVEGHLLSAMKNNFKNFFSLDKINHNGQVEWEEWLKDFNQRSIHIGENPNDRIVKEKLAAARAAWSEAARSNPDSLNIDEFLAFTHPESSHSVLAQEAEELLSRHDTNGDGIITEAEYLKDPFVEFDPDELADRRRVFRQGFDADKNGKADKREVLTYLDPKHPFRSLEEAERLFDLADNNEDGFVDLNEVLDHAMDFYNSRWANPEKVFHGDLAT